MNTKPCMDDSCDAIHCPVCGGHKLGWYVEGLCSSCEQEKELKRAVFERAAGME